jgi:hypothetical protein
MDMKPRITFNVSKDGEFQIWVNEAGRDLLIKELQASERNDHFHLGAWPGAEVELSSIPYEPTDKLAEHGKVLFRPDAWDRQHYPHVFNSE